MRTSVSNLAGEYCGSIQFEKHNLILLFSLSAKTRFSVNKQKHVHNVTHLVAFGALVALLFGRGRHVVGGVVQVLVAPKQLLLAERLVACANQEVRDALRPPDQSGQVTLFKSCNKFSVKIIVPYKRPKKVFFNQALKALPSGR